MPEPRDNVKPVIYQLVVRLFGNTNTTNRRDGTLDVNGCGKFDDINEAALASLRGLGVTHVWLTGCLRQATLTDHSAIGLPPDDPDVVKGIAGSFYAVRDYFDVCPDYAMEPANRLAEFEALTRRIHGAGMKVLIDLVPNHVARGYASVVRPELDFGLGDDMNVFFDPKNHFFYLVDPPGQKLRLTKPESWSPPGITFDGAYEREDGGPGRVPKATGNNCASPSPAASDWYETVKLNYGYDFGHCSGAYDPRPRTWDVMDEVLAFWQARGVDGFRCDFAHYVPAEAWSFLIGRARERDAAAVFIAEAYPWDGSGDPITDPRRFLDAGFDGFYHYQPYNAIKRVYQGTATQDDYNESIVSLPAEQARHAVRYLENHDERRIASPIVSRGGPGESGFGGAHAGYLLAPLQLLSGPGPVLLLNGQEVGEPGAGAAGFSGDDGRTSVFDYWAMPAFVKWVSEHRYDGARLNDEQRRLRRFYADLLALCQDPSVCGDGYWGLKYLNRPDRYADCPDALYSYARFHPGSSRLLLVAGNFDRSAAVAGRVRLPAELMDQAGLPADVNVRLRLDRDGARDAEVVAVTRDELASDGLEVTLAPESSAVYAIA